MDYKNVEEFQKHMENLYEYFELNNIDIELGISICYDFFIYQIHGNMKISDNKIRIYKNVQKMMNESLKFLKNACEDKD